MSTRQDGIQEVPIGDFCQTGSGGTPSRSKAARYFGGSIPWVKSGELRETLIMETEECITAEGLAESAAKLLPANTLLVALYGATVGRIGVLGIEAATNQAVCYIIPDERRADRKYIFYALQSRVPVWLSQRVGGGQPNISQGIVKETKIPLPPLSEQKRIADILDKADAIRRKRQEERHTLATLRSSVFLRLFGDSRTQRSDWPEVTLGDVTVLDALMVDPRHDEYIDLVHLGPDRIEKNTGRLLPALTAREEGLISGKFLFDERYLLYSKIRPYLRKVALPHFKGLCSADIYPIRPVENLSTREYLFALLISEAFLSYTTSLPSRASIPKLNRKELAAYTFSLPPIELQQQYTEMLRSHDKATVTFGKAADESECLFNSLVQRAFKGEL